LINVPAELYTLMILEAGMPHHTSFVPALKDTTEPPLDEAKIVVRASVVPERV
jgi:hypothetical protein